MCGVVSSRSGPYPQSSRHKAHLSPVISIQSLLWTSLSDSDLHVNVSTPRSTNGRECDELALSPIMVSNGQQSAYAYRKLCWLCKTTRSVHIRHTTKYQSIRCHKSEPTFPSERIQPRGSIPNPNSELRPSAPRPNRPAGSSVISPAGRPLPPYPSLKSPAHATIPLRSHPTQRRPHSADITAPKAFGHSHVGAS